MAMNNSLAEVHPELVSEWSENRYQMSGNKISVKTLDLNRDFSEIAAQLNAIVTEHFS